MARSSTPNLAVSGRPRSSPGLGVAVTIAVLTSFLAPIQSTASTCVVRSRDGNDPPRVFEARRQLSALAPERRGGLEEVAAQAEQNRKDFDAGLITAAEAEANGGFLVGGNRSFLVLPVLYDDTANEPISPAALDLRIFADFFDDTMYAYFEENSYGQFSLTGDVWDFVRVAENGSFYDEGDSGLSGGGAKLALATMVANDAFLNFGDYDNDGPDGIPNSGDDDGFVDIVAIIQPEVGAECGAPFDDNMWSHQSYLSGHGIGPYETNDNRAGGGKIHVDRFFVAPALNCDGTSMIDIGVLCHEFGHALGIPDLYDTDDDITGVSAGIGVWGLMGAGNWNSPSSPGHFTAFSKHKLGWLTYFDVLTDQFLCLPAVEDFGVAARLWTYGNYNTHEYFIVENRQPIGFDSNLRGSGLVIYHIDEDRYDSLRSSNRVNADETWKAIDVETPDTNGPGHYIDQDDLDDDDLGNSGDGNDVWCQTGGDDSFDVASGSDPRAMSDTQSIVSVRNIGSCSGGAAGGGVCGTFNVGVSSPVDLCINDCAGDNCNNIATCEDWWATPDIWVDHDADGNHDLPSFGIDNKIWYRIKNLGPDIASGAEVSLYLTKGAMGLEWPQDASVFVGTRTIPVLAAGEETEDYFVFQYNELLQLIGHWCMGIVITHPDDPNNSGSAPLTNNVAQINQQVLIERAGSGEPFGTDDAAAGGCSGAFSVQSKIYLGDGYNPTGGQRTAEVRIGTPPNFNDAIIPNGWTVDFNPRRGPYTLGFQGPDSVTVTISTPNASHGDQAHVPLTLWDINTNQAIGGITLDAIVDCVGPRLIPSLTAEWRPIPGDVTDAPNVELTWNRTLADENGEVEFLDRYQVFRSINGGLEELVDELVVDVDVNKAEFQWYDTVDDNDCPTTYSYRVRAIDAAGNVGQFSPVFFLPCEVSDAPVPTLLAGASSRAFPNPFSEQTEIHYELTTGSDISVSIYDATGQRIRGLGQGWKESGVHRVRWDGTDEQGRLVASGVYFYQIVHGSGVEMKKIIRSR